MKKKLIIINREQFGYNTATYYYCEYLKKYFSISYICWDNGLSRISMDTINTIYILKKGNYFIRGLRFIKAAINEIHQNSKDDLIIFIKYIKIISILVRLLNPRHIFVLDIRTEVVLPQKIKRIIYNFILKLESKIFNHITIISEGVAKRVGVTNRAHILPLGADIISTEAKNYKQLDLLYVGTLFNRNIEDTIRGFSKFYHEYKQKLKIRYTIVGGGTGGKEENILKKIVAKYELNHAVKVIGQIPIKDLKFYFDTHNLGISYVPMTDYYNFQPVTKTFEYLLSGMPVIATNTSENKKIINEDNGVLIDDNPNSFYEGIKTVWLNRNRYDSEEIRNSSKDYSWENIISNNLKPYLDGL